ncbi:MFS transporter [Nonomuraea zeae]|uniref:MFS transporter n=2 Tax=Nonomuraea zeae TaxID=1642303 RepID=A0A5S4FGG8_9ACTN|nr:MFS transporter [Nonomuraea zeae]
MVSLMQTLIIPLIPSLPALLGTSAANASWAITASLLAGAVATPVAGRLGDLYGKRRLAVVCAVLLTAGSLVCALSNTLAPMVIGRALQGFGIALVPLGISIMRDVLPPRRLGSAMAMMSSSIGVGSALGLPLAALVAQYADWHVLFWAAAALGALTGGLVLAVVPESPLRARERFDALGALGLSAGLVLLLLPVSKGGDWGWSSPVTLGLLAASAVMLLLWGAWELRSAAPLVDLRTSARRQVLMTNLASVVVGFAMFVMALAPPQILQLPEATGYGLGQSMLQTGLWLAPGGLVMMGTSRVAALLSARRGPKVSLLAGTLVIASGYAVGLALTTTLAGLLIFSCIVSAGVGFAYAAMPALIMGAVPRTETAAANGLNSLARAIGTSASSAVIGVVLADMTTRFGPAVIPTEAGVRATLLIGGGAALLAALIVLTIPGRTAGPEASPAARSRYGEADPTANLPG